MNHLVAIVGILWWMLAGSAVTLGVMVARGKKLYNEFDPLQEYRFWLGRKCEVKVSGEGWHLCTVVAVSHKGAVAVRKCSDKSGKHAFWIPKDRVEERVIWR